MRTGLVIAAGAALLSFGRPAHSHIFDEYLQATLFTIEQDRVEALMRMTPGVAVASVVLAGIDTDGDGAISESERRTYAERVLRDISLTIDGNALRPHMLSVEFPLIEDINDGLGEIQIRFSANLPPGAAKRRLVFENRHQEKIAAYLVNSLVPRTPGLRIVAQQRNRQQSRYQVDFARD
jgi:hypothetical protein